MLVPMTVVTMMTPCRFHTRKSLRDVQDAHVGTATAVLNQGLFNTAKLQFLLCKTETITAQHIPSALHLPRRVTKNHSVPDEHLWNSMTMTGTHRFSGGGSTSSDDDERARLSTIYSLDSGESGARSAFRLFRPVVSVPQPSPDYYNPYVRKVAEDDRRPVSRDANARDINQPSGNSDSFSLRTTTSSRKDILRSRENSCRVDDRTRREDVCSGTHSAKGPRRQARDDVLTSPHTGEGEQLMPQCSVPSSQSKTYSDLDRGEFFGTPSDSTQREGETDKLSKGEGHIVPAEAESNMPTTRGAKGVAAEGDFTRAEVDTELTNFPGYTPNITDDEVRNRMQRCKDNTYILWYSESEQRPALGVVYNSTFMTFTIKKRSSYSGTKFFVDRDQKDGYSLTELLQYHLEAGIKDTRPSSYRQKIMLKYPFLE
ncbi:uncharacterized protein LOC124271152 [Haliotis rubra]|uniref:uncharacterized protein LOC124271152 n=1 Tax=Haliotis rubra TaxID=36100 RepID=UPI001EE62D86|nr:uncharacterized protein LOC124271152 [Haliotis rubra]